MKLWLTNHVAAVSVEGVKEYQATPADAVEAFGAEALLKAIPDQEIVNWALGYPPVALAIQADCQVCEYKNDW